MTDEARGIRWIKTQDWENRWAVGKNIDLCAANRQRDPSNVKSITAQAELFDSISHDWADTRFPGVYSGVFFFFFWNMPRDLLRSCLYVGFAADWVAEYSWDKLLTWVTQSRPEQSCLGLKGNTYRETESHAGQRYPLYTYVLTKGLVSRGEAV